MDKLRKKLEKGLPERGGNDGGGEEEAISFELVAVDAPHEYVDEVDEELVFDDDDDNGGGNNSIKADTTTPSMLQWWRLEKAPPEDGRGAVRYAGLEVSLERVRSAWMVANGEDAADGCCCGILGFSQGARLAHLICVLHQQQHAAAVCSRNGDSKSYPQWHLPGLQFVILVAGYDASLPVNLFPTNDPSSSSGRRADEKSQTVDPTMLTVSGKTRIDIPSLHVWGKSDRLIVPEQSRELSFRYSNTQVHIHEGGHHVPMQAASIRAYLDFIQKSYYQHANADGGHGGACWNGTNCTTHNDSSGSGSHAVAETLQRRTVPASENLTSSPDPKEVATASTTTEPTAASSTTTPDNEVNDEEEARQAQHDELEAIQAIYPDEFHLLSRSPVIRYLIDLVPSDEGWWPPKLISLDIAYPVTYPINSSVGPIIKLLHDNNVMEFSSVQAAQLLSAVEAAAFEERGMCCVLSCLLAARDYFESGLASSSTTAARRTAINTSSLGAGTGNEDGEAADRLDEGANGGVPAAGTPVSKIKASTPDRIKECNVHGLAIAESILKQQQQLLVTISENEKNRLGGGVGGGKRGAWTYTIGLVGKPSVRVPCAIFFQSVRRPTRRENLLRKVPS
jgi:predicted esterase